MPYIATMRFQVKPGTAQVIEQIEQLVQERLVPVRQDLLARGDLPFMTAVRADEPADHYDLITHWASREALDRYEESSAERERRPMEAASR